MKPKYIGPYMGGRLYQMGECNVLLSGPEERTQIGWHFSISCKDRHPTWEEQRDFRYSEIPDDVYMVQVMPPKREYVAVHDHCFHWHEAGPKFFDIVTGKPKS